MMNDTELDRFKDLLVVKRVKLLNITEASRESARTVELDQQCVGRLTRMDALQGQAMSLEILRRNEIALQRISSALRRVHEGNYGICVKCDEDIAAKRLEIDPAALLCIGCAEQFGGD